MSAHFEEIDRRLTPMGEISLRRRLEPTLLVDVYEVKLDDEFLMSSLFTVAEVALARLALAELPGSDLDVVVGGLGLGYTARAVAEDSRVRGLYVIDALREVIEWHQHQLLPHASELTSDQRCHLVEGDFFAIIANGSEFGPHAPDRCHAILLDIDHTPRHHLHPSHASFYTRQGLTLLADRLQPGGVFAMWSDSPPDIDFVTVIEQVFESCETHVVTFPNFYTDGESASTVYVATIEQS